MSVLVREGQAGFDEAFAAALPGLRELNGNSMVF